MKHGHVCQRLIWKPFVIIAATLICRVKVGTHIRKTSLYDRPMYCDGSMIVFLLASKIFVQQDLRPTNALQKSVDHIDEAIIVHPNGNDTITHEMHILQNDIILLSCLTSDTNKWIQVGTDEPIKIFFFNV
ncbi:hypothetical protein ACJX0J_027471, partial [Zea mays]